MNGEKGSGGEGGGVRTEDAGRLKTEVLARLRAQLALMQGQVRRLDQALSEADAARAAALVRLQTLRGTADRLEQVLEEQQTALAPAQRPLAQPAASRPAGTWQPVADGGPQPVRFLVAVDLRDHHVEALLDSGLLARRNGGEDAAAVAKAVQELLDRWSRGVGCRPPANAAHDAARPAGVPAGDSGRAQAESHDAAPSLLGRVGASFRDWRRIGRPAAGGNASSLPPADRAAGGNVVPLPARYATGRSRLHWLTDEPLAPESAGGFAGAAQHVQRVDGEAGPYAAEGDEVNEGERFVVGEDGKQELSRRRDVLQKTQGDEANAAGAGGEQDQR